MKTMHMKKQKRENAKTRILDLSSIPAYTLDEIRANSLTNTIKYLQTERRMLLAKIRRTKNVRKK